MNESCTDRSVSVCVIGPQALYYHVRDQAPLGIHQSVERQLPLIDCNPVT